MDKFDKKYSRVNYWCKNFSLIKCDRSHPCKNLERGRVTQTRARQASEKESL